MQTLLTVVLVIISIIMIILVLLQPDKSQTTAKTMASLTQEKDGIEKLTEYIMIIFMVLSIVLMLYSKIFK